MSFKSTHEIEGLKKDTQEGRNPKEVKTLLAKEITSRFHGSAAAVRAEEDFNNRSKGGIPEEIPQMSLPGAPLGITAILKNCGLAPSGAEAGRLIEGSGVRVDGVIVSDKGLKLSAGTYVVQVGKRKFMRVALSD